jgi:hypothetical protein
MRERASSEVWSQPEIEPNTMAVEAAPTETNKKKRAKKLKVKIHDNLDCRGQRDIYRNDRKCTSDLEAVTSPVERLFRYFKS